MLLEKTFVQLTLIVSIALFQFVAAQEPLPVQAPPKFGTSTTQPRLIKPKMNSFKYNSL